MSYDVSMKKRLSTVIGKGRGKMSQLSLAKIMGIAPVRIHQLLNGTRGENNPWVHHKYEWVGKVLMPLITKITYHDKCGGLKTILRKEVSE